MSDETTSEPPSIASLVRDWPRPLQGAWFAVVVTLGVFVYALARYWLTGVDTWDRLLIVFGSLWAWNRMRPDLASIPGQPQPWLGLPLITIGFFVLAPLWYALAQVGPRPVLLWLLYGSALAALAGMTLVHFGWSMLNAIRFPLFFVSLALPIPSRINTPLQEQLQNWTTTLAHNSLHYWGFDVVREGFVLRLPHGDLGVVEACSGIRSVTALTAIAVFLAHLRGFRLGRGVVTVALAIPIIVLVNGVRVFLTGLLQEYVGREMVLGWKHEALGFALIFVGLGLIVWMTKLLDPKSSLVPASTEPLPPLPTRSRSAAWCAAAIAIIGLAGGLYGLSRPSVARTAVPDGNAPIEQIPMKLGDWDATDLPVDPEIEHTLQYNRVVFRRYRNRLGYEVVVWVIYWTTANAVAGGYHHPDHCMPNHGSTIEVKKTIDLVSPGGRTIPVTYREFRNGRNRTIVQYWTQEGRYLWNDEDERNAADSLMSPFRWIAKRTGPRPADAADDRIVVLMGTSLWGDGAGPRTAMTEFSGYFADELYRVCPWADPGSAKRE
jgi:EpsI family protein